MNQELQHFVTVLGKPMENPAIYPLFNPLFSLMYPCHEHFLVFGFITPLLSLMYPL